MRMSIGQALGIKTAGERLRAAERAADRRGRKRGLAQGLEQGVKQGVKQGAKKERERNEALNARRVKFLRSQNVPDSVISTMLSLK